MQTTEWFNKLIAPPHREREPHCMNITSHYNVLYNMSTDCGKDSLWSLYKIIMDKIHTVQATVCHTNQFKP